MTLTWLDYLVITGYLLAITAFGSWFARFQKTTRDYFLTDRSVPWWAICFTVVATETSTLSFIGVPAQAYAGNMTFLQLALGYIVGRLLVSVLFIPAYFRGDLYTSYELLQRRFGASVKNIAAVMFLVTRTLADGVRLFATALVITVVTQVPVPWTIVIIGVAMIIYTTRGGASAVIWTDVVQMFVYIGGAAVVLFALLQQINGGWDAVRAAGEAAGKFTVLDFSTDPRRTYTFWAGIFGGVALTLATHGTDQYLVQRLLSARSPAGAASGLILSGFIVFAQFTVFLLIGILLFVFYQQTPLPRPLVTNDEVLPLFVVTSLSHGAAGFIVAAIVAAALSPSINALAATTVNDFYLKYVRPDADQPTLMRVSRIATIFWGVAQIGVALGAQWIGSVLDAGLAVLSLAAGPVLGAFLVGVLTTRVGSRAMVTGMLTGIAVLIWVWYTAATAWTWYAFIGAVATSTTAVVASYFLPGPVPAHLRPEPDA
jgi:SSS family solute:Na+ symporter